MEEKAQVKFILTAQVSDKGDMTVTGQPIGSFPPGDKRADINDAAPGGNLRLNIPKGDAAQSLFKAGEKAEYVLTISKSGIV